MKRGNIRTEDRLSPQAPTSRIYLSPPHMSPLEETALLRAMRSGWVAPLGPEVDAFERELAAYCGRSSCVALSSGTAALHLALLTLGIGAGDLVLTSTMTFAATTNAILYTGAHPVFIDSDQSGNINPELLAFALQDLIAKGERPRLILPVDLMGKVVDHERIAELASSYELPVLADAAESLGSRRSGRPSAAFGVAAALSFNGNKVLTTSGGGALLTDDEDFAKRVRYLATQARQPVVHYEHTEVGYNYRLSNLLAAVGRAQLTRLEEMVRIRRSHRRIYEDALRSAPGVTLLGKPFESANRETRDNCWLTSVLIDSEACPTSRDELLAKLAARGIEARPLWKPMHLQPAFQSYKAYVDGTSENLFIRGLSLPSGSVHTSETISRVAELVRSATLVEEIG